MAEKFRNKFGTGAHQLKIGNSFQKKGGNSVYHSIKYDFKPFSVDEEQMGTLEVQENKSVSVQLPHVDGHGSTNYKGNAKPANTKDCILIIDHETGELTLERISNQIMLKKTRPEKSDKPSLFHDKSYNINSSPSEGKDSGNGLIMPSNPYQPRPEPKNPRKEIENSSEVRKEEENPYEVKPRPSKPKIPNRPNTPQSMSRMKKGSPSTLHNSSSSLPALFKENTESDNSNHGQPTISPLHSNKNSPARPSPITQGYNVDSLGRVISESSDDSDSGSSSGSDSDSDSESTPGKGCQLAAAMDAADGATSTSFGLPGDLSDLLLPGNGMPSGPGHLPTARPPQKMHKSEKQKPKPTPHPPISKPLESSRQSYSKESHVPASMPTFGSSMPTFGDLGDDLQLSDDSD